jgi:rhodanese-related sulfurtransferase
MGPLANDAGGSVKKTPISFDTATANPNAPQVEDVDPSELAKKTALVHIVDVRGPDEFTGELGHIAGAKLIVLDTLPEHIDDLPKDEPIVFICKSGGRSARATAFAKDAGFEHVFNMKGGMLAWNSLGLPTER